MQVKGIALAVADGISTSNCSDVAAETAVKSLVTDYYATPEVWTVKTSARRVIEATNSWLFAQSRRARISDLNHGLVCTLSALVLKGREAHIFHVGDSQVSRVIDGALEPLTRDHVAYHSDGKELLGRALGAREHLDIDYRRVPLQPGDLFLLTTDGVHGFLTPPAVEKALQATTFDEAARRIADAALDAGSEDNLTVQLVRIDAVDAEGIPPALTDLGTLPRATPVPGQSIDAFEVLREIHNTTRSQLVLARDASGSLAVLKVPGIDVDENPEHMQRFAYEEWIARRISSPHVVKAAASGSGRSACYVALQYIEGRTLRQWMTDNPQPSIDEVRAIAEQVSRGLRALHRRETIHQDLRPENIMLDGNGTAVIIDLGSVAVAGLEEAAPGLFGVMPGTFQYTAPEYLAGDIVSWRSDQYALGVIVYEMLTGRLPYGAQVARVRSRRDQQRLSYATAADGASAVPDWVDFALARACHRDPMRRYDALSEFIADLRRPSPAFKPLAMRPLLEKNPLRFWQVLALLQALAIGVLTLLLLGS